MRVNHRGLLGILVHHGSGGIIDVCHRCENRSSGGGQREMRITYWSSAKSRAEIHRPSKSRLLEYKTIGSKLARTEVGAVERSKMS